jgi:hypothetical protein
MRGGGNEESVEDALIWIEDLIKEINPVHKDI